VPTVLNLGCGTRTSSSCTNIDWTPYARVANSKLAVAVVAPLLGSTRGAKLRSMSGVVVAHDLRKGIPCDPGSVDGAYLSHVLEHLDRGPARDFLREILRVLAPGGVVRLVVPDLRSVVANYESSYQQAERGEISAVLHEESIVPLLEQSVRRESRAVPSRWPAPARRLASLALGDARRRGETHQWMYDDLTLTQLLLDSGFESPRRCGPMESDVPGWSDINLDIEGGTEYKPGSLYIEANAPATVQPG